METKFKDNTSGEEIVIKGKNGEMLTLSNGLKIKSDFFITQFTTVYTNSPTENVSEEVSAEIFFSHKTEYLTEGRKTKIEHDIKLRQEEIQRMQQNLNNAPVEAVDAINFLHSPTQVGSVDGLEDILKIDTTQMREAPESQGSKVMIKESIEGYVPPQVQQKSDLEIAKGKRLSETDLNKFRQIDENDEEATQKFLKKQQQERDRIEATGGGNTSIAKQRAGITNHQEISDEEQISGNKPTQQSHLKTPEPVDFITQMFKSFKRNHKISVTLEIEDHISEPEFIKLMSNNLDADIIGLYTQEILGRVLSDVVGLEQKIHDVIEKEVYGKVKKKKEIVNEINSKLEEDGDVKFFSADKTKTKKQRYYFYDPVIENVVKLLKETGAKKKLKPATMKQIKKNIVPNENQNK